MIKKRRRIRWFEFEFYRAPNWRLNIYGQLVSNFNVWFFQRWNDLYESWKKTWNTSWTRTTFLIVLSGFSILKSNYATLIAKVKSLSNCSISGNSLMTKFMGNRMSQTNSIVFVDTAWLVGATHSTDICNAQCGASWSWTNISSRH